jgi:hypothetical protein
VDDWIVWLIIIGFYAPLHYLMPALVLFITGNESESRAASIDPTGLDRLDDLDGDCVRYRADTGLTEPSVRSDDRPAAVDAVSLLGYLAPARRPIGRGLGTSSNTVFNTDR